MSDTEEFDGTLLDLHLFLLVIVFFFCIVFHMQCEVCVIGAGLSGLRAAQLIAEETPLTVCLIEVIVLK